MADFAGGAPTASEVIPAGHAALPADDELREDQSSNSVGIARLGLAALGVALRSVVDLLDTDNRRRRQNTCV